MSGRIVRFWNSDVPPERVIVKWRDKSGKAWVMEYKPTEPEPDVNTYRRPDDET